MQVTHLEPPGAVPRRAQQPRRDADGMTVTIGVPAASYRRDALRTWMAATSVTRPSETGLSPTLKMPVAMRSL